MRNVSIASLAKLQTRLGTEPVCILEIQWQVGSPVSVYADKAVEGMQGRIVNLASLEDVINVSKSGTSQSVEVTLDDTDGELKNIFDNTDIHKKKVWVYQWFTGIPLTDKILLFVGQIASPVTWKEGDRTLSFTIMSMSLDLEVGFSPEEGQFPTLPQHLIGQVWPIVFGSVMKLPGILIDDIPSSDKNRFGNAAASVTKEPTGISDPSLKHRIDEHTNHGDNAAAIAQAYFVGYLEASFTARKHGELGDFDNIEVGKGQFSGLAKQYLQQGNAKLLEAQKLRRTVSDLKVVQDEQKKYEKKTIGVTNGSNFKQGTLVSVNLGGALHTGIFNGDVFTVTDRFHPAAEKYDGYAVDPILGRDGAPVLPREVFFYADAGTPLKIGYVLGESEDPNAETDYPVRYVVASKIQVAITGVFAFRTFDNIRQLVAVPGSYYTAVNTLFGALPVTLIWMGRPLSSRLLSTGETEGWEDDIWVSCTSPIGPNTVDIIIWLIENYTGRTFDPVSFAQVRNYVAPYPMHFAVLDRPNVLKLIGDIAYQARCIVWLKNDVFYIKYLAKADPPVDTITEDDVLEQTLEVSYTETEDIYTKLTGTWKADYKQGKEFLVVLRYNILYYGVVEKSYNFFCFNMLQLVEKAATFWLIRDANTFKRLKIKVPISKLNLETLDTVTLNFSHSYVANGPVNAIVEEAKLDTASYTVDLSLWIPVRAGEMVQYLFAYPGDLTIGQYFPTETDISQGRAREPEAATLPEKSNPDVSKPFTGDQGNGGIVRRDIKRPNTWGVDPVLQNDVNQIAPTIIQRLDPAALEPTGKKPKGTTKYKYSQPDTKNDFKPDTIFPRTYPGIVIGRGVDSDSGKATYTVTVFQEGLGREGKVKDSVIFTGSKDQNLESGSGVIVSELFLTSKDGTTIQYYMQGSQGGTGRVFPGKIKDGSGEEYTVKLYRKGTDETSTEEVTAFQLQIDEDETIPVDTWILVNELIIPDSTQESGARKEYYIQVPVWL